MSKNRIVTSSPALAWNFALIFPELGECSWIFFVVLPVLRKRVFHALIHLTFSLVGVYVQSELNSSDGRLDVKVETDTSIYIIEFKFDKSATEALQQIHDKQYFKAYSNSKKRKIGIGINFSKELKTVEKYLVENFGHPS